MLTIATSFLLFLHPASQAVPPDPEWNCDDPMVQQEMNWCAARDYAIADTDLNEQWEITSAEMKRRDEAFEKNPYARDTRPGYFETLLEAQRAWIAFRDAECALDYAEWGSGSMRSLRRRGRKQDWLAAVPPGYRQRMR